MARSLGPLRKAQLGKEVTWGTGVAATYVVPSVNEIRWQATDAIYRAEKLNGSLAQYDNAALVGKSAAVVLNGYACPQFLPYILEGATHTATPAADAGTPIAYTRTYTPTLTAEDVPVPRTIEVGSNITAAQWRVRGGLPTGFGITGRIGEPAMCTSNWIGRALEVQAFTAALTAPTYTQLPAKNAKFWIDNVSGTMGTTAITDCITEFAFASGDLWALVNCIDGTLEASGFAQARQAPSLTLTFQLSPTTQSLFADMEAGQQKLVRLELQGNLIHGSPTTYERIRIDMAAHITAFPEVGGTEAEGGLVAAITFSGSQDHSGGSFGKLIEYSVVSMDATLV